MLDVCMYVVSIHVSLYVGLAAVTGAVCSTPEESGPAGVT